jgi:hypothetical protein
VIKYDALLDGALTIALHFQKSGTMDSAPWAGDDAGVHAGITGWMAERVRRACFHQFIRCGKTS